MQTPKIIIIIIIITLQPYATGVNLIIVCKGTSRYGNSSENKIQKLKKNIVLVYGIMWNVHVHVLSHKKLHVFLALHI